MKTTYACIRLKSLLICISLFAFINGFSQPDYVFKNSSLISGTARQIGAKYRFPNVKAGTDGIITITDIKKIVLDDIDGASGYADAFQPVITVPKKTKGYVEFQLDFVFAGTTIPKLMLEVPLTAIDIDGYTYPDEKVYEFDEFLVSPVYFINYDFIGSSLDVSFQGSWIQVINKTAVDYPGVDTIQRDVMFSMVHAAVSSVTFRVGGDNKSKTDIQRLRSLYFKKFNFPNSPVLAQSPIIHFAGKKDKNSLILNWEFANGNEIKEYALERAVDGRDFAAITSTSLTGHDHGQTYNYTDITTGNSTYAYRLKITNEDGRSFYSQVIFFKDEPGSNDKMNIYPNVIRNGASVQVSCETALKTTMQIVDYSGRTVYKMPVQFTKGVNSFYLDVPGQIAKGNYIVVLPMNGTLLSKKIVIE